MYTRPRRLVKPRQTFHASLLAGRYWVTMSSVIIAIGLSSSDILANIAVRLQSVLLTTDALEHLAQHYRRYC